MYIHGPGGVGKTTLLQQFALLSKELQIAASSVDARDVQPSPASFVQALQQALNLVPTEPLIETFTEL